MHIFYALYSNLSECSKRQNHPWGTLKFFKILTILFSKITSKLSIFIFENQVQKFPNHSKLSTTLHSNLLKLWVRPFSFLSAETGLKATHFQSIFWNKIFSRWLPLTENFYSLKQIATQLVLSYFVENH